MQLCATVAARAAAGPQEIADIEAVLKLCAHWRTTPPAVHGLLQALALLPEASVARVHTETLVGLAWALASLDVRATECSEFLGRVATAAAGRLGAGVLHLFRLLHLFPLFRLVHSPVATVVRDRHVAAT